jgi:ethanolamine ammonia-lyase small subunit
MKDLLIQPDPWASLKAYTSARIALGRAGTAIPLKEVLSFKLAHAHARDAVYSALAVDALQEQLQVFGKPIYTLHSEAADRHEYLQRPDKGRKLNTTSQKELYNTGGDLAIIIADGLSATAVNIHAYPLLQMLVPSLQISLSSICLVQQGRVAIADEIGASLKVKATLILIGERPGLSAADSLGAYLTFGPKTGNTDEARNCISNIRAEGLSYALAAGKINYLLNEAFRLQLSGVALKDNFIPALPLL